MPHDAESLIERWQSVSLEREWRMPADWPCASARAVADVVADGGNAAVPLEELARWRALQGVGIAEALSDLFALFDAADSPFSSAERRRLTQAYSDAWADESFGFAPTVSCTDPVTGLATAAHFTRCLHDLYEDVSEKPDQERLLASIRMGFDRLTTQELQRRGALTGTKARSCLGPLGALMTLKNGTLVAVLRRSPAAFERLRDLLGWARTNSPDPERVGLDLEPLPRRQSQVHRLLSEV
ncbi:hypothetical protein [Arthrobacter sp. UM1]|uniref:hypothetical protein n=1 Tax=Arthrobacter sp. UM1 TaxID=2766776 RepID=UPI001CF6793B|nr:hypothetical protein [Arthrobacter sp. UM1]MCB4208358.1 hypothetical protein [Arthrobacter sp. UM1]